MPVARLRRQHTRTLAITRVRSHFLMREIQSFQPDKTEKQFYGPTKLWNSLLPSIWRFGPEKSKVSKNGEGDRYQKIFIKKIKINNKNFIINLVLREIFLFIEKFQVFPRKTRIFSRKFSRKSKKFQKNFSAYFGLWKARLKKFRFQLAKCTF